VEREIAPLLPAAAEVKTGAEQAESDKAVVSEFITFIRGFLLAFGGIALFVGSFVIANSLGITIAQRTREFATIRTIGASRKQVLGSIILEALVVGILASVLGLFLGLGLANALFSLFDAVGFTLPNTGLVFETRTIVVSLLVGILVTLVASLRPAIRATRVPPIAAVREGATLPESRFAPYRTVGASVLTLLGFAAIIYSLFAPDLSTTSLLIWLGLGALLVFVGFALLSVRFIRPLAGALGWPATKIGGAAGALAPPILTFVLGGLFLFVFRFFYAAEVNFRQALMIVSSSFAAVALLTTPLMLGVLALKGDWTIPPQEALQANLTLFLERQGRHGSGVAAGLGALRDHQIAAGFHRGDRVAHLPAHARHEHAAVVAHRDDVARYTESGDEHRRALPDQRVDVIGETVG
jgi:predicted lysophospholipase L1 biosynthesis ABC-type transport system permease subunit